MREPGHIITSPNEGSTVFLEVCDGLNLGLEGCNMFIGHLFNHLDEVLRYHLSDGQKAAVPIGAEGTVENWLPVSAL